MRILIIQSSTWAILIIQSSMWAMWFCDVAITPLARAWPANLALCPRLGVYFGVSEQNCLCKCTGGHKRVGLPLSSMCGLRLLGLSAIIRCVGSDRSIAVRYAVTIAIDTACARMTSTFVTFCGLFQMFLKIVTRGPYIATQCL